MLYLLHGSPGFPTLFINAGNLGVALDTLVAHHRMKPMLVAMPSGHDGTFKSDTEWANTPHGRYEDFVLDVVRAVDHTYPTLPGRAHRGIAGDSEGAYAAVNIALHHLRTFSLAESWSGYFTQSRAGPFKHASIAKLAHDSPSRYAPTVRRRLRRLPLHAFIYTGRRDHERRRVQAFARELARLGGHVTFGLYPGRHEWRLWRNQTPHMLVYASRWLA